MYRLTENLQQHRTVTDRTNANVTGSMREFVSAVSPSLPVQKYNAALEQPSRGEIRSKHWPKRACQIIDSLQNRCRFTRSIFLNPSTLRRMLRRMPGCCAGRIRAKETSHWNLMTVALKLFCERSNWSQKSQFSQITRDQILRRNKWDTSCLSWAESLSCGNFRGWLKWILESNECFVYCNKEKMCSRWWIRR